MPPTDLTLAEVRVLGCLIEKQRTTPDHYPLSLNALRNACNQSTNRDPVTGYDSETVHDAARGLIARRWARSASGHGGRALKYRHLLQDALALDVPSQSLLAVLMLRGAQTPGELKQRTARLYEFADTEVILEQLGTLIEAGYVRRIPRRPGQKEDRYLQLLDFEAEGEPSAGDTEAMGTGDVGAARDQPALGAAPDGAEGAEPAVDPGGTGRTDEFRDRLAALEDEVAELKRRLDEVL